LANEKPENTNTSIIAATNFEKLLIYISLFLKPEKNGPVKPAFPLKFITL
jgi:hypothetical protein